MRRRAIEQRRVTTGYVGGVSRYILAINWKYNWDLSLSISLYLVQHCYTLFNLLKSVQRPRIIYSYTLMLPKQWDEWCVLGNEWCVLSVGIWRPSLRHRSWIVSGRAVDSREKNGKQDKANLAMLNKNCPGVLRKNPKQKKEVSPMERAAFSFCMDLFCFGLSCFSCWHSMFVFLACFSFCMDLFCFGLSCFSCWHSMLVFLACFSCLLFLHLAQAGCIWKEAWSSRTAKISPDFQASTGTPNHHYNLTQPGSLKKGKAQPSTTG